jgi:hypothetical protein
LPPGREFHADGVVFHVSPSVDGEASMKWFRCALTLMVVAGAAVPDDVLADRGRGIRHYDGPRVGIHIGVPLFWNWPWPPAGYVAPYGAYPPHYPYPLYYPYPPIVREPAPPPVYIERAVERDDASAQGYWYYCDRPEGYYPYVRECPGGWERVAPRPPG